MGDPAGESADRLHLLRLTQLVLELRARRDIDEHEADAGGRLVARPERITGRVPSPVRGGFCAGISFDHHVRLGDAGAEHTCKQWVHACAQSREYFREPESGMRLDGPPAQRSDGRIHAQEAEVAPEERDAERCTRHRGVKEDRGLLEPPVRLVGVFDPALELSGRLLQLARLLREHHGLLLQFRCLRFHLACLGVRAIHVALKRQRAATDYPGRCAEGQQDQGERRPVHALLPLTQQLAPDEGIGLKDVEQPRDLVESVSALERDRDADGPRREDRLGEGALPCVDRAEDRVDHRSLTGVRGALQQAEMPFGRCLSLASQRCGGGVLTQSELAERALLEPERSLRVRGVADHCAVPIGPAHRRTVRHGRQHDDHKGQEDPRREDAPPAPDGAAGLVRRFVRPRRGLNHPVIR